MNWAGSMFSTRMVKCEKLDKDDGSNEGMVGGYLMGSDGGGMMALTPTTPGDVIQRDRQPVQSALFNTSAGWQPVGTDILKTESMIEPLNDYSKYQSMNDYDGNLNRYGNSGPLNNGLHPKGGEMFFKFDPEYIAKLQSSVCLSPATTIATPLTSNSVMSMNEHYNFNDVNCQSKPESPCSSPVMDPFLGENALLLDYQCRQHHYSSKQNNVDSGPLPSIQSAFGSAMPFQDTNMSFLTRSVAYNNCTMDDIDVSFLDQFTEDEPVQPDAYNHPVENYHNPAADQKPNREFKDIWGDVKFGADAEPNVPATEDGITPEEEELFPLECLWAECHKKFANQRTLVSHIGKQHVELKKGDEFACYWVDCPRRYRPFNARYKLLIHMRVHSGEKPNKCLYGTCDKAFSRLENLKIHQRSHTGERPYNCQFDGCPKAFSNSSDRAKHQRTHYDTKPYACQKAGCNKRYTDPSSLRKHVKNHGAPLSDRRKSYRDPRGESPMQQSPGRRFSEPTSTTGIGDFDLFLNENSFDLEDVFEQPAAGGQILTVDGAVAAASPVTDSVTTMDDFNDLSNCLLDMLQPDMLYNVNRETATHGSTSTNHGNTGNSSDATDTGSGHTFQEYVSYECVKYFPSMTKHDALATPTGATGMEKEDAVAAPNNVKCFECDIFNAIM